MEELSCEMNGTIYRWQYDDESQTGVWSSEIGIEPPLATLDQLRQYARDVLRTQVKSFALAGGLDLDSVAGSTESSVCTPFNHVVLRDWFFRGASIVDDVLNNVVVMGNGPFEAGEFEQFLDLHSVQTLEETEVLILGRRDWDPVSVDGLIECRQGKHLRVYSQEMMLSYLGSNRDPFDTPDLLPHFLQGHAGLEWLAQGWPGWVTTSIQLGWTASRVGDDNWADESPLKAMGYGVGRSGPGQDARRQILRAAFEGSLPATGSSEYMKEWGANGSAARLRKMAESIASHCRNMKRRTSPSIIAIRAWESDLDWLKSVYYRGHMRFQWPSSEV